jgi:hypothetical protein
LICKKEGHPAKGGPTLLPGVAIESSVSLGFAKVKWAEPYHILPEVHAQI